MNNAVFAKEILKQTFENDQKNMLTLYNKLSDEEKIFINEFMKVFKNYKDKIIYNEKSGCINFCYDNMQIGRIRLNKKKHRMQILRTYDVEWIENITLEDAINNIDKWLEYLNELLKMY